MVTVLDVISDGVKIGLGSLLTILGTWLGVKRERKSKFAEKRFSAVQGVVQLCDFLMAAQGQHLGQAAGNDWNRIRSDNLAYGALLPEELQQQYQAVLRDVLFRDHFDDLQNPLDINAVRNLRADCLEVAQKESKG
jgi:hypothetical protein